MYMYLHSVHAKCYSNKDKECRHEAGIVPTLYVHVHVHVCVLCVY